MVPDPDGISWHMEPIKTRKGGLLGWENYCAGKENLGRTGSEIFADKLTERRAALHLMQLKPKNQEKERVSGSSLTRARVRAYSLSISDNADNLDGKAVASASVAMKLPAKEQDNARHSWRAPSTAFPQGDLFGLHLVTIPRPDPSELQAWEGGIMPVSVRASARFHLRASGMRHDDLAARVGLSRPQLTNVLHGRFGTCPTVAAALKAFVLEATEQAA